jgi:ArsR family transcriptional regulator
MEYLRKMADIFQVLADKTRLRIFKVLDKKELCVSDIAKKLDMTQSAISHQLRILRQADLVRTQRKGKKVFYRIADKHVFCIIKDCLDHVKERK